MIAEYLKKNIEAMTEAYGMPIGLVIGSGRWQNIAQTDVDIDLERTGGCFFVNTIEETYADGIVTASVEAVYCIGWSQLSEEDEGVNGEYWDICRDFVYKMYHDGRKVLEDKWRIAVTDVRSRGRVNFGGDNMTGVHWRCTIRNTVPKFLDCETWRR